MPATGQVITPLPGYPQPWGSKIRMLFDRTGPKSYANIGSSSGKGDVLNASDLGLGGFEVAGVAFQGFSSSGNYAVRVYTGTSATAITNTAPFPGSAVSAITIVWYAVGTAFVTATTEVSNATDLSAETIRIDATMV